MASPFILNNLIQSIGTGNSFRSARSASVKGGAASVFAQLLGKTFKANVSNGVSVGLAETVGQNGGIDLTALVAAVEKFAGRKGIDGKKSESAADGRLDAHAPMNSPELKGHALIAHLKQTLIASGQRPNSLTADHHALAAIEKLLVGAGFDPGQVRDLFSELKQNSGGKGVRLSTLFAGISRLEELSGSVAVSNYLAISTLPHLQTLLTDFGFSQDAISSLLNKAKVEGKGIDAGKLADGLKRMASGSAHGRFVSQDKGDKGGQARIEDLLKQIGLAETVGQNSGIDLTALVAALEKFAGRKGTDGKKSELSTDENPRVADMIGVPATRIGRRSQDAESGRLSPARFAAVLERNADGIRPDSAGDWQTFVKNLHPAAPGARMDSESGTDLRLLQPEKAPASLFVARASLFSEEEAGKSLTGPKAFAANKALNTAEFGAPKTDGPPIGAGEKTMIPIGDTLAAARATDRAGDVLFRSMKAAQKTEESSGTFLGDGGTRRPELFDAAAKASAQPSATAKTLPFYVLNQVSRQILRSRLMNESEIQLQLTPPSLGRLKVTIEQTAAGLKVNIIAENTASKDMLLSNSGELKTALLEQGLRVDKIDVETQANFDQAMADARQDADRRFGHKRFAAGGSRLSFDADPADSVPLAAASDAQGAVNLVA